MPHHSSIVKKLTSLRAKGALISAPLALRVSYSVKGRVNLPSKHLLSAFYKRSLLRTLQNTSKNLAFAETLAGAF